MMALPSTGIRDCVLIPVSANRDERGCLFEIFRESWPGLFPAVQWNVCSSNAGVVRGAHVHVNYSEFYTLPLGRVVLGLADIRSKSPTFGRSIQLNWSAQDGFAVIVPVGVAHVVLFEENSLLAFGLSGYWDPNYDVVGCQWDAPELCFTWPTRSVSRSERDANAGGYPEMLRRYDERLRAWRSATAAPTAVLS
jgi:dTDP-4-dehydrorhamnose 3,5-epimerase